ncbi:WhiB family transcriptional regulator [Leifsonia sp. 71-9]|uniref:WhiB family transcriptional regulator n=1 Tax=Leifsonia sp. 71-9 TaxID=1895934 RepID=UPI00092A60C7|nr:WhiB family transcriptional regulator [Leifsonia sp. 71-9]OJX72811.1 MAG: hypothetical protein BGO91_13655 [Leifsonia sp. 71-9]
MTADMFDLIAVTLTDETALDWMADAACATTNPDAWFPESGESPRPTIRICTSCEVRTQCLQYAIDNGEYWGTWGGLTARELRKLRHQLGDAA